MSQPLPLERTLCPECLHVTAREVSRPDLFALGRAAGCRIVRIRRRRQVAGYWWCDRCRNGGAFLRLATHRRGA